MAKTGLLPYQYWSHTPEDAARNLQTRLDGLTSGEAAQRLETYGPNQLRTRKKATPLKLFLGQFNSPIIIILLFATVLSAVLQDWLDALIILVIILISAILSFVQEYNANNAAEKLRSQVTVKAKVLRDGQVQTLPASEVVPGDIILLSAGSLVPGMCWCSRLRISSLTRLC